MSDFVTLDGKSKTLSYIPGTKRTPPHYAFLPPTSRPLLRRLFDKPDPFQYRHRLPYARPLLGQGSLHALVKPPPEKKVTIIPPAGHRDTPPSSDQMGGFSDLEKGQMELALKLEKHKRSQSEKHRRPQSRDTRQEDSRPRRSSTDRHRTRQRELEARFHYPVHEEQALRPPVIPDLTIPQRAMLSTQPTRTDHPTPILPTYHPTPQAQTSDEQPETCFTNVYLVLQDLLLTLGHLCGTVTSAILIFLLGIMHITLASLFLVASILGDIITMTLRWFFNLITCRFDLESWRWEWNLTGQVWKWGRESQWVWHTVDTVTGSYGKQEQTGDKVAGKAFGDVGQGRPMGQVKFEDLERGLPAPEHQLPRQVPDTDIRS